MVAASSGEKGVNRAITRPCASRTSTLVVALRTMRLCSSFRTRCDIIHLLLHLSLPYPPPAKQFPSPLDLRSLPQQLRIPRPDRLDALRDELIDLLRRSPDERGGIERGIEIRPREQRIVAKPVEQVVTPAFADIRADLPALL